MQNQNLNKARPNQPFHSKKAKGNTLITTNQTKKTILLYGRTRGGKSTQIGELVELVKARTGKNSRLYTADKGGLDPIQPYVTLGWLEVISMDNTDPWVFLNKASRGMIRDLTGKWVPGDNTNVGVFAFESMTSFADALMADLAMKAANGLNVGGTANVNFTTGEGDDKLKIGGNNMAHYNVVQTRITEEVWQSQKLPCDYLVWTASMSKDDDPTSSSKVLGPQVVGRALTSEVPRWFQITYRIDCVAGTGSTKEKHILYMTNSTDLASGNAVTLANNRLPLDAPEQARYTLSIEPASIKKALEIIEGGHDFAVEQIKKRVGKLG